MRGTEGIHCVDVAQLGHFLAQLIIIFAFAFVETHVLEQHDFAVGNFKITVQPILDDAHFLAQ